MGATSLIPFIAGLLLLLSTPPLAEFAKVNVCVQLVLFVLTSCIPCAVTGRMSYVDLSWPWGVAVIGALSFVYGEGSLLRRSVISLLYLLVGLRMALAATGGFMKGWFKNEFPRYRYAVMKWKEEGVSVGLHQQMDIVMQGLGNSSFLALPAILSASNKESGLSIVEMAALALLLVSLYHETLADIQKNQFMAKRYKLKKEGDYKGKEFCDVGLWGLTRHPNYFFEWMVWNSISLFAIPSFSIMSELSTLHQLLIAASLTGASISLYVTLVYVTGAIPAEYFSAKKREGYTEYQQKVNMFFPKLF
eukprot:TRINITY_DN265_c2_g1_i2.p1 TRINITY_DN265_c2_g1~~TRINITY_DN265_c2_g1_i2.p1  ORF type:complete len:314 (-),score=45.39 TRINITY_DN265_c2_g1_i2:206-1120(-)